MLSVCYDAATDQIEEKETIRLLSSGKEDTLNFVMVAFDGEEYWTRDIFIAKDSDSACTVIEEVYIYSSPENIGITSEKINAITTSLTSLFFMVLLLFFLKKISV